MARIPPLGEEARQLVIAIWSNRARLEFVSEARFRRLAVELAAIDADPTLVELAERAAEDESRHAALCAQTAAHFGGSPLLPPAEAAEVIAPAALSPRDRALYEIVAFCCITETVNASYLTTSLNGARDAVTRHALHQVLRDEVTHSRFGWAYLSWERARGPVEFLGPLLPAMLHGSVSEDLFEPEAERPELHRVDFGVLPRAARLEMFRTTLEEVVLPGLELNAIDTRSARAWLEGRGSLFSS